MEQKSNSHSSALIRLLKRGWLLGAALMMFHLGPVNAQNADAPTGSTMMVEPSTSTVAKGKVSLIVDPLTRQGDLYVGAYQIKVVPYFFKNEKGQLELKASEKTMSKLLSGEPVSFTGTATNAKNGKFKVITGHATPSTTNKGEVTFSVQTENGEMVFETSYHFKG